MTKTDLLAETKLLLNQHGLHARKGLAQHFLTDRCVLEKIVEAAELKPDDLILEVGPGPGVLTRELVKGAGWVIAVELDDKLAGILKENAAPAVNMTVVNRDILQVDPGELIKDLSSTFNVRCLKFKTPNYKVVANLPYYITSAVLRHFLEASMKPEVMVIMVQEEIAQAITAPAGKMSLLSVSVQFYGKPVVVTHVPKDSFYPAPKVDSAVLRIDLYPKPVVDVDDPDAFFRLVKAGFKGHRKQLINSLSRGLNLEKEAVLSLLEKAGIDFTRRAQTLTMEEWGRLYLAQSGHALNETR